MPQKFRRDFGNRIEIFSGQTRITIVMMLFFAIGIMLYKINAGNGTARYVTGLSQSIIWIGLIVCWCILTRRRLIQKGVRRYITAICVFLAFWFILRGCKYYLVPPGSTAARYLWYAYYFPMMFYPVCAVCAMTHIGRMEDWKRPLHGYLIFLPSLVITILVLTNDLHQWVFRFPNNGITWSDINYSYGPLYPLSFAWFLICTGTAFIIMIRRCRIPQMHPVYSKLPLLPPFFGICYGIAYVTGHVSFFSDLIIAMSFFTVWTFELAIRQGYIRSNTHYEDIFFRSSIAARIYDADTNLIYASGRFEDGEDQIVEEALDKGSCIHGDMHYVAAPIQDGHVVWKENVGELVQQKKHLEEVNEFLEDRHMVLQKNYETNLKRQRLEAQNQLYNAMQSQTENKLQRIEWLLDEFQHAGTEQEASFLLQIGILTAYLKRRNNLIFIAQDQQSIPISELRYCLEEIAKVLDIFGIDCMIYIAEKASMTFQQMVDLFDAFEQIVEETFLYHPVYFLSVTKESGAFVLRIRMDGIDNMPKNICDTYGAAVQEEGEYLLEIRTKEAGYEEAEDEQA